MTMSRSEDTRKYYPDGAILIEGDRFRHVCPTSELDQSADREIDAGGKVVLPGLINGHNHHEQSFMKAITRVYPGTTYEWIHDVKIPLTREMDADDYYLSNMLTCIELLQSGVTCSVNHICQQDPAKLAEFGIEESVRSVLESGIRSVVPIGVADVFEPDDFLATPEEFRDLVADAIDRWHRKDDRVRIWPGPAGVFSATEELWRTAETFADGETIGIYTHLASAERGEVETVREYGLLREDFVGAHCVWLDQEDIETMAEAGIKAVHNPTYKLSYSVDSEVDSFGDGIAPMAELKQQGGTVGVGQDGCMGDTQDLFKELRNFAFTQQYRYRDKSLFPPTTLLAMATVENARALLWDDEIGSIEPGKKADLVVVDLDGVKFDPVLNVPANVVYQATADDVDSVLVGGEVVLRDGELTTVDETALRERAQRAAEDLLERAGLSVLKEKGFRPWTEETRLPSSEM
jgi:5-methylthioadenosine/S-adenosylhomocysteine deaminase